MPLLSQAGFLTGANWERLTTEERANISSHLLPDAFDVFDAKPDPGRMKRLDMLWGIFFATGDLKPVRAVVRMLAWHNDYASLSKLIESGQKPTELTESVMRGVMYRGAGWSLRSLSLEDGLLADYIDYLRSATETPDHLKQELASLNTNPAFDLK
jgi:hypothetical protein